MTLKATLLGDLLTDDGFRRERGDVRFRTSRAPADTISVHAAAAAVT